MSKLPIVDAGLEGPSCVAIAGGLSNEQVEVARQMRALKERMCQCRDAGDERGLEDLRVQWQQLERERDDAWRRKMKALGHDV